MQQPDQPPPEQANKSTNEVQLSKSKIDLPPFDYSLLGPPPKNGLDWIKLTFRQYSNLGSRYKIELLLGRSLACLVEFLPTRMYQQIRKFVEKRYEPIQMPKESKHLLNFFDMSTGNDESHLGSSQTTSFNQSQSQINQNQQPAKKKLSPTVKPPMPECWGHRGASAAFPENTIASFDRAIRDGAEGLESDVHVTSDDVVIMFHDPSLSRTTDGKGLIREQPWKGKIENVRTKEKPHQQIPTFAQVCELLMRPENRHVKLNIDIKPENDPERLFKLMRKVVETHENFETDLSPRLILGLWHPVFLKAALEHLPTLRRVHIGGSPTIARTYFWKHCDGFSMWFPSLVSTEGQNFIAQAKKENKDVFVWTVNRRDEMIEATRWGVKAILTDKTDMFQTVRQEMQDDFVLARSEKVGMFFRWATFQYWMVPQFLKQAVWMSELEGRAGCTFKQAWRDGALDKMDVPQKVNLTNPTNVDNSPNSITTLTDADVPPLSVGKAASDLTPVVPSMVASA